MQRHLRGIHELAQHAGVATSRQGFGDVAPNEVSGRWQRHLKV
jgi:hypothetical protein